MTKTAGNRGNRKYNWGPVENDMDKGLTTQELSDKYSIPAGRIFARRRERRLKLAEMVLLQPNCGIGEEGEPAPRELPCQVVKKNREFSRPAPPEALIPEEFSEKDLESVFSDPAAILALPPAEAEKLFGRKAQLMLAAALANAPEAKTLKDVATIHKIFRDANGLTGDKAKGGNGLLTPPRAFGRRAVAVIDVPVTTDLVDEWPEGMLD